MPSIKKLVARLLSKPTDMACQEVQTILKHFGWTLRRQKGSHEAWRKDGYPPITLVADGKKYNRSYLVGILKVLDLEDADESQE